MAILQIEDYKELANKLWIPEYLIELLSNVDFISLSKSEEVIFYNSIIPENIIRESCDEIIKWERKMDNSQI